jgi:hypothetical protein
VAAGAERGRAEPEGIGERGGLSCPGSWARPRRHSRRWVLEHEDDARLSRPNTARGRMQRLVLQVQREHEAASTSVDVDGSLVRTKRFRPQSHRTNPGRCSSERPPKKGDLVIMPVIKIIRSSQKLPHGVDQGNGARVVKAIGDVHPICEEVDHPASATRASGTHGPRSSTGRSVPPGPGHCESLSPLSIDDMSLPLLGIRRPHSVQVGAVA